MRVQDYIADQTKHAAEEAFRYAKAVPADKLDWKPEDTGRSVIDMCQEMAMAATWGYQVIKEGWKDMSEGDQKTMGEMMKSWTTPEQCEAQFNERFAALEKLYRETPDADLSNTKWLPFNGGRDHTVLEMMDYPRWNCTYHLGQIAYIQILYGDREMH